MENNLHMIVRPFAASSGNLPDAALELLFLICRRVNGFARARGPRFLQISQNRATFRESSEGRRGIAV